MLTWILAGLLALTLLLCALIFVKFCEVRDEGEAHRSRVRNRDMLIEQLQHNIADNWRTIDALRTRIRRDRGIMGRVRTAWQGIRAAHDPIRPDHGITCSCRWCLFDAQLTLLGDAEVDAAVERDLHRESNAVYDTASRGSRG